MKVAESSDFGPANSYDTVAATTFLRSALAGAFPLFISPQLDNMGVGPGMTVYAGFSVLLIPIPYLFYFFGERIRARGAWSKDSVS